jgi:predicted nucleic acid-binding protein
MSDVAFVDSDILIYAHDRDASSKRERAAAVLDALWESGDGRLSVQVLQEFFVHATGKLNTPLARTTAREVVQTYAVWVRESTTANTVTRAIDIADLAQLSFWDALIVASAEQAGATLLYSEDLNDGQKIVGVTVRNPLVETIGKT